jgi:hypothetical protein
VISMKLHSNAEERVYGKSATFFSKVNSTVQFGSLFLMIFCLQKRGATGIYLSGIYLLSRTYLFTEDLLGLIRRISISAHTHPCPCPPCSPSPSLYLHPHPHYTFTLTLTIPSSSPSLYLHPHPH